jgi:hypothetical protein
MTLFELAVKCGLPYDRAVKIVGGYRQPTPREVEAIAAALEVPVKLLCRAERMKEGEAHR